MNGFFVRAAHCSVFISYFACWELEDWRQYPWRSCGQGFVELLPRDLNLKKLDAALAADSSFKLNLTLGFISGVGVVARLKGSLTLANNSFLLNVLSHWCVVFGVACGAAFSATDFFSCCGVSGWEALPAKFSALELLLLVVVDQAQVLELSAV